MSRECSARIEFVICRVATKCARLGCACGCECHARCSTPFLTALRPVAHAQRMRTAGTVPQLNARATAHSGGHSTAQGGGAGQRGSASSSDGRARARARPTHSAPVLHSCALLPLLPSDVPVGRRVMRWGVSAVVVVHASERSGRRRRGGGRRAQQQHHDQRGAARPPPATHPSPVFVGPVLFCFSLPARHSAACERL